MSEKTAADESCKFCGTSSGHHSFECVDTCGKGYKKTAAETFDDFRKEIHANAREATARQVYRAVIVQERPDIAVALILQALDDWYKKGMKHATTQRPAMTGLE